MTGAFIREAIIGTREPDGSTHLSPLGVHVGDETLTLMPFRPSRTLENLSRSESAVINYTDDVRVFAGCLTQRKDWPLTACGDADIQRLSDAIAHAEVRVVAAKDDETRPSFICAVVREETHRPFRGFNRAQAAVIELAILVSRLHMLPMERILKEMEYLRGAYEKTAGERERAAWQWLSEAIEARQKNHD